MPIFAPLHPSLDPQLRAHRKGMLSRREFLTRATALGASGAVAYGLLGLQAPSAGAQPTPSAGGALRVQMELPPLSDPRLAAWPQTANFYRGWLETLAEYQPDGRITGQLLTAWEVSQDARHYRLHLREGVLWSNGDPLTAEDIVFNLRRWCDSGLVGNSMAARLKPLIDPATGQLAPSAVEIAEPHLILLHLASPDATLMATLCDYPAVVVHPSFSAETMIETAIGTGPWRPQSYVAGDSATLLRASEHWWNRAHGGPWLERIDYVDYGGSPGRTLEAARAGAIDMTGLTSIQAIEAFDALGWNRHEVQTAATLAIRFNLRHAPFDNPNLRHAIISAVKNEIVLEIGHLGEGLLGENHHVCPLQPDYAALPPPIYDREAARAQIAALSPAPQTLELVSLDDDWQAASCDAVAVQCRDAGLQVTRRLLPAADYWQNWRDHPWSGTEWSMRPLGVQIMALGYHSQSPWNESAFADPDFDNLLQEALGLADPTERQRIMAKLQIKLREAGVLIQPFWRKLYRHSAAGIHGAELHPMQLHQHSQWWREPVTP